VATPGGITEVGAKVLRAEMPGVFDRLLEVTLAKHEHGKRMVREEAERILKEC
jgi:hypothetical protein